MNKILYAALAASTVIATPALASSDSMTISGEVPYVCTVDAPADNNAVNLNGDTALGDLYTQCNDPDGWSLDITSANGFKLVDANTATYYPYVLHANNNDISSDFHYDSGPADDDALIAGGTSPVSMTTSGPQGGPAYAGTYADTVTWTLNGQ